MARRLANLTSRALLRDDGLVTSGSLPASAERCGCPIGVDVPPPGTGYSVNRACAPEKPPAMEKQAAKRRSRERASEMMGQSCS
jgi:hypothetical protein